MDKPIVLIHDQRKTINILAVLLLLTAIAAGWGLYRSFSPDRDLEEMKLSYKERLRIAQVNRAEFIERHRLEDSVNAIDAKIRAINIEQLKQKGLWK